MAVKLIEDARRQIEICNACRYCEGFCSVFPAITRDRQFSDGSISQLANLCHDCRGCYYACQYTEPHEFALNIPDTLAKVRRDSWQKHVVPSSIANWLQTNTLSTVIVFVVSLLVLIGLAALEPSDLGEGFYGILSHNLMVLVFAPVFILPLISIGIAISRYWKSISGEKLQFSQVINALINAAKMRNLDGGHGEGCNYEDEDRFSNHRRWLHQATMYGFLLCFAATGIATVWHYVFNDAAPYTFFSLPKLLGIGGGILLSTGTLGLAWLKTKGDRSLGDASAWNAEMAFILLLFFVSTSGLLLYVFGRSELMPTLLKIHLASVMTFFLLMPYTKMIHGFFRLTALVRDEQLK